MPEGDTIHRTADTLQRAIGGQVVTRFESVLPKLVRVDADTPLRGRTVERVEARGKHVLIWFSGDLVLRTHMRMNGSWHIYRPGERWQRPHRDMRIVIETAAMHAVAFTVPVAELVTSSELVQNDVVRSGVKLYKYRDRMAHGKVAAFDGRVGTVGSTNLDMFAMERNAEINAFIPDARFCETLEAKVFRPDVANSKRAGVVKLGFWQRLKSGALYAVRSFL